MTGARITIETGDDALVRAVQKAMGQLRNPQLLLEDIGEAVLNTTRQHFREMVDPGGVAWKPLSPWYAASKPKNKDKILTLIGYLSGAGLFP